jgi:hypothetical protein
MLSALRRKRDARCVSFWSKKSEKGADDVPGAICRQNLATYVHGRIIAYFALSGALECTALALWPALRRRLLQLLIVMGFLSLYFLLLRRFTKWAYQWHALLQPVISP